MNYRETYTEHIVEGAPNIPGRRVSSGMHIKGQKVARELLNIGPGCHKVARFEYDRLNINNFRCGVIAEDLQRSLKVIQRKDGAFVNMFVMFKCDDRD